MSKTSAPTYTAKVAHKNHKLDSQHYINAEIIVEFGVGIRVEVRTLSRVTKANGYETDTNSAYRTHPINDLNFIAKEDKIDCISHELVHSYVEYLEKEMPKFIRDAEQFFDTPLHV